MNRAAAASITSNPNPRIFAPDVSDNSNTAESSIRPRNRRLISTEQELVSTSGTSTPAGSRAVSPIPSKYPSRAPTRAGDKKNGRPVGGLVVPGTKGGRGSPQPQGFGGLWEGGWTTSWTALQGLASSVLGVDTEGEGEQSTRPGSLPRKVKKKEAWGPEGLPKRDEDAIGVGSVAEREAAVRARRMRGVLEGREDDLNVRKDLTGNYKRRTSTEETRLDGQEDEVEDALVYIHQVQPQDTLAGVILKYNCQPAVFRKANRFWPNDSIQTRKHVVIPVDATTIKGRPCEPPTPGSQGVDLLAPTPSVEDPPFSNGNTWPGLSSSQNETSAERTESEEHPWTHVRWVLIDSSPSSKPVEIARMPRKTLGYFPPRRRKSQNTISTVSTPRGSFDLPRIGESSPNATGSSSPQSRRTSNLGPRPSQPIGGSYFPPIPSSTRSRRESVSDAADRMGWMRGPGGVGTFGKNVRRPGPGQDGLNAWAKKHIPGLAIDDLPSASIVGGESAHFGFNEESGRVTQGSMRAGSGTATPSAFAQGLGGQGLGIENAAAAIEGWVRRLAIKGPGTPKMGGRTTENTDLIELLDGAGSDDGRGFELTPGTMRAPIQGLSGSGSGREDLNGVMRGKATAGAKGGKSD